MIARIEAESKGGLKYKVLDDLIDSAELANLKKPSAAVMRAFKEAELEQKLYKDAPTRGIDPKELKKTARNLRL